jgi:hypothetical protein
MGVYDPILGDLPQPQMEWHRSRSQIFFQPPMGFDHHVLNDVADVNPPLNPLIEPHLNHPPDAVAMAFHQLIHSVAVPRFRVGQHLFRLVRSRPHARSIGGNFRPGTPKTARPTNWDA